MSTIRVFSGGAPKEVFLKLTPQFEKASGHKVEFVFAVMSTLKEKVAKRDAVDVLVMPTNMLDPYEREASCVRRAAPSSASFRSTPS